MAALSKLYSKKEIDEIRKKLVAEHGDRCAICGKPGSAFKKRLNVDHEHKKGTIRGLLCFFHNKYFVGKFDITKACVLLTYLVRYDNVSGHKQELKALHALIEETLK